jgi:hypothetical protein
MFFFLVRKSHVFRLYPFVTVTYLPTLPRSTSGEIDIPTFAYKDGGNPQTSVRTTSVMAEIRTENLLNMSTLERPVL